MVHLAGMPELAETMTEPTKVQAIRCPFGPCNAQVRLLFVPAFADAPKRVLIKQHAVEPGSWFGHCPSSNQDWPLSERVAATIRAQEELYARMAVRFEARGAQRGDEVAPRGESEPVPEHSRTPHPDPVNQRRFWRYRGGPDRGDHR